MSVTVSRFVKGLRAVDGQDLLVGQVGLIVVALPLGRGRETTSIVPTNEQVDSNERILSVHVAKGSLLEMLDTPLSKLPAATWFLYP